MIVIVKVSARRYMVIDAPTVESAWRSTAQGYHQGDPADRPGYIYGAGDLIAGPADFTTCDLAAMEHAKRIGKIRTAAENEATIRKRAEAIK